MAERDGTSKPKPLPARMERAILRIWDSISDWTERRLSSVTSRHLASRSMSARVRVLEEEDAAAVAAVRSFRISRMAESGFSLFLNGSRVSSSESASARRRFLLPLSAIFTEREREKSVGWTVDMSKKSKD